MVLTGENERKRLAQIQNEPVKFWEGDEKKLLLDPGVSTMTKGEMSQLHLILLILFEPRKTCGGDS